MHPCEEKKDGCRDFLTLPRSCIKKGANKQLRFEIFVRDSRKILVGPKCPYTHAVKYQPWNRIPVQTELITLYRQRKKNIGALF